jgi:hypothetical protein
MTDSNACFRSSLEIAEPTELARLAPATDFPADAAGSGLPGVDGGSVNTLP